MHETSAELDVEFDHDEGYDELRSAPFAKKLESVDCNGNAVLEYEPADGDHGQYVYVRNKSGNKVITVTLEVRFEYLGTWKREYRTVRVPPGARVHVGNTRWKFQKFYWAIVGCSGA